MLAEVFIEALPIALTGEGGTFVKANEQLGSGRRVPCPESDLELAIRLLYHMLCRMIDEITENIPVASVFLPEVPLLHTEAGLAGKSAIPLLLSIRPLPIV